MDEQEYEIYLRSVFGLHERVHEHDPLQEQLRDSESGDRVLGCYRTVPANAE